MTFVVRAIYAEKLNGYSTKIDSSKDES